MVFQILGKRICIKGKKVKIGLSAELLEKNLRNIKNFGGILSMDDLDRIIIKSYPLTIIVYYKKHWISIYIDQKELEVFDSTASVLNQAPKPLIRFLCRNGHKNIKFSNEMQGKLSKLCGYYALYFILMKSKNYSWKKIIETLNSKINKDDYIRSVFNC